jgi:peroxiredoxin/sugar lactone lactonase YvrE
MTKKIIPLILCIALSACSFLNNAPKFTLDNADKLPWLNTEKALTIDDLKNKLVVVYFFHFADETQLETLEILKTSVNRYPDELLVLGVNIPIFKYEKNASTLRNFCLKYGLEFPIVHDENSKIADANSVFSSPLIFVLDYKNQIIQEFEEMPSKDDFMALIRSKIHEYSKKKKLDMQVKSLIFTEKEKLKIERRNENSQITSVTQNGETIIQEQSSKKYNLFFPCGVAWNEEMEVLAIADTANHQIKIVDKYSKLMDIVGSGAPGKKDGKFRNASFKYPHNLVFDGKNLIVIDKGNDLIRLINLDNQVVQTLDARQYKGYNTIANFANGFILGTQKGLLLKYDRENIKTQMDRFSSVTGLLYAKDIQKNKNIKAIFVSDGKSASVYASGKNQLEKLDWNGSNLVYPQGLAYSSGNLYVADTYENKIKIFDLLQNSVKDLEINIENCQGDFCQSVFEPYALIKAKYGFEDTIFIADSARHRILRHTISNNKTEIFFE